MAGPTGGEATGAGNGAPILVVEADPPDERTQHNGVEAVDRPRQENPALPPPHSRHPTGDVLQHDHQSNQMARRTP